MHNMIHVHTRRLLGQCQKEFPADQRNDNYKTQTKAAADYRQLDNNS